MKKAFLIVGSLLLAVGTAQADQITKPHTFTAGTPAQAEQVNADFDTVYDQVNKIGAAITVDGNNEVGIGTATPVGELHVTKPHVLSAMAFSGSGPDDIHVSVSGYNGTGTTSYVVRVQNAGPEADLIEYSSDGGATWSEPVSMHMYGLDPGVGVGNNVMVGFTSRDGHAYGDQWAWTVSQGFPDGLIVLDGKVTVKKLAITDGAAAGQVLTSDASGNAAWQPAAPDADNDPANELQTISRTGDIVTLSNDGGWFSVADNDSDPNNEMQSISRTGDTVTLSNNGGSFSVADNDSDPANELQTISRTGSTVTLSNNGGTFSIDDGDNSSTNEYNSALAISGTVLQLTDGGGLRTVDLAEKLSINDLLDARGNGDSVFLGSNTGMYDDGTYNINVGIGEWALHFNNSGYGNNAIGSGALRNNTGGYYNQGLGVNALYNNTTGIHNIGIGGYANYNNQAGSYNVMLGYQAGWGTSLHDKSGDIFIGYQAGYSENGSDKLYIDNSSTTSPLIYGDFATNALTVNGSLTATGALMASGNATVAGTSTLTTLAVTGNSTLTGTLDVAGNGAIGSAAGVSTTSTLKVAGDTDDAYTGYYINQDTAGSGYGLYAVANGSTARLVSENHYGVYGAATGGNNNYGLWGYAHDTGATTNYGVYAYAGGGTNNYAGYFEGNLHTTGNITYNGTITDTSDARLKENIRPVENALAKIQGINGVYFNMKDNLGQTEVGVIAQDVEKVLPEAVSVIDKENGYMGVSYPSLIPVLIEAVKELKAENEALRMRVEALENQ